MLKRYLKSTVVCLPFLFGNIFAAQNSASGQFNDLQYSAVDRISIDANNLAESRPDCAGTNIGSLCEKTFSVAYALWNGYTTVVDFKKNFWWDSPSLSSTCIAGVRGAASTVHGGKLLVDTIGTLVKYSLGTATLGNAVVAGTWFIGAGMIAASLEKLLTSSSSLALLYGAEKKCRDLVGETFFSLYGLDAFVPSSLNVPMYAGRFVLSATNSVLEKTGMKSTATCIVSNIWSKGCAFGKSLYSSVSSLFGRSKSVKQKQN